MEGEGAQLVRDAEAGHKIAQTIVAKRGVNCEWPDFLNAYHRLCSERQIGMAIGPIPDSAIREYMRDEGLTGAIREAFHTVICALDTRFMEKQDEQRKKEMKSSR